eukprot:m.15413 g.15413  ORF g.15413 m.15413 type:complete len:519 (-) comp10565_c0_seq1:336-1892(-)
MGTFSAMAYEDSGSKEALLGRKKARLQASVKRVFLWFGILIGFGGLITGLYFILGKDLVTGLTDDALANSLSIARIEAHLQMLQSIAGNRSRTVVSQEYDLSAEFIAAELEKYPKYFTLSNNSFNVPIYTEFNAPTLATSLGVSLSLGTDFDSVGYSAAFTSGEEVSFVSLPLDGDLGCNEQSWESVADMVVLVPIGGCSLSIKASLGQKSNASALLFENTNEFEPLKNLQILGPGGLIVEIPMLSVSGRVGEDLRVAESAGTAITTLIIIQSEITTARTFNLIAETNMDGSTVPVNERAVVMVGAHLDSVHNSPGINDNGSGSASLLEIAMQMARLDLNVNNVVRFAWWTASDLDHLGSSSYLANLTTSEQQQIKCYINLEMLASPNYIRVVFNGTSEAMTQPLANRSKTLTNLFVNRFDQMHLNYSVSNFTEEQHDHRSFLNADIAVGGLFTGSDGIKTVEQRTMFQGLANTPYDPCYQQACDTMENVNFDVLKQMSSVSAYVIQQLAVYTNFTEI